MTIDEACDKFSEAFDTYTNLPRGPEIQCNTTTDIIGDIEFKHNFTKAEVLESMYNIALYLLRNNQRNCTIYGEEYVVEFNIKGIEGELS